MGDGPIDEHGDRAADAGIWRAQVSGPAIYANTVYALAGVLALDFVRSLLLRALATRWFMSDGGSPPCARRPARHQAVVGAFSWPELLEQ
jgi:hypothetical protein